MNVPYIFPNTVPENEIKGYATDLIDQPTRFWNPNDDGPVTKDIISGRPSAAILYNRNKYAYYKTFDTNPDGSRYLGENSFQYYVKTQKIVTIPSLFDTDNRFVEFYSIDSLKNTSGCLFDVLKHDIGHSIDKEKIKANIDKFDYTYTDNEEEK